MAPHFEQARDAFLRGLRAQEGGRLDEAEQGYRDSLALVPGRASTLNNLGVVLAAQWRDDEALPCFEQALAAEPADATTWVLLGQCQARLGRLPDALASADRALALNDTLAAAWALRGGALKDLGRLDEAAPALRESIRHGADPALQGYLLASIDGRDAPPQPPASYVQGLFDGYAAEFDEHLVGRLQYQAPQTLVGHLAARHGAAAPGGTALDLGCGTGLCGPGLRPLARHLVGVDLSAGMLQQAHQRGCYDELVQADVAAYLQTMQGRADTIVAADVFIYIGDLQPVFAGVQRVLAPGGWLALSVEEAPEAVDYELRRSARYAQSARYLHALAAAHGLQVRHEQRAPLRQDQGQGVDGLYLWLQAPG